jgi:conjugative relaxase-like TrwC/TraI family protein
MRSAKAAVDYLTAADYLATSPGDLLGKGFDRLDISGMSPTDVMRCLAYNLDPATGEVIRPHAKDGDRVGMDFTFNSPKSVGLAREMAGENNAGDPRIEAAHREAVAYTMGLIESEMETRVRAGGKNENRTTGNLFAYRVTHRDTRINSDDQRPDPSLHDHVFVMNLTYDPVEKKFKAAEVAMIKHDAPFYEAVYHNRLAGNLKSIGYGVERKGKGFEIAGVSRELIEKYSRRSKYIDEVAAKLGIVNPKSKAKLGATTRLGNTTELADDLNGYYVSRLTAEEKQQLASLEGFPSREVSAETAVQYAIGHHFETQSVVDEKRLYETALRFGIGSGTPQDVKQEAKQQGLLVKGGEATTKGVLAEEARVIAFARNGRGSCRALEGNSQPIRESAEARRGNWPCRRGWWHGCRVRSTKRPPQRIETAFGSRWFEPNRDQRE